MGVVADALNDLKWLGRHGVECRLPKYTPKLKKYTPIYTPGDCWNVAHFRGLYQPRFLNFSLVK
jgi:hypothetical protein